MIEHIKRISNPLTIVAIFAALAEVSGTIALGLVEKQLQPQFIWFVMLFPVFLVTLFFIHKRTFKFDKFEPKPVRYLGTNLGTPSGVPFLFLQ